MRAEMEMRMTRLTPIAPIPPGADVCELSWNEVSRMGGGINVLHDGIDHCRALFTEWASGTQQQLIAHCPHRDVWFATPVRRRDES